MTEHPITPPPELIQKWSEQFEAGRSLYAMFEDIYRAGADAELEACCEWLAEETPEPYINALRFARRPKPPSLKGPTDEELLQVFDTVCLSEGGTVDEIHLRGLHAVLARWGK